MKSSNNHRTLENMLSLFCYSKLLTALHRSCFFVIVGGKYLNKIGSVMEKVDSIINDIGGTRPLAVFIISNNDKDNIVIDINHSFDRYKSTPVMVKLF